MKTCRVLFVVLLVGLWSLTALAASPEGGVMDDQKLQIIAPASKAFGDPTDFKAAGMASAQYVMNMQSPTDGGWDWNSTIFVHSGGISSGNLYGVTASVLYVMYQMEPTVELFNAMTDAANWMVAFGPDQAPYDIDSGPDIVFLMSYASLPGVASPMTYTAAAKLILDTRKSENGNNVEGICDLIYNSRGLGGLGPWDMTSYCVGAKMLGAVYGAPYLADAVAIADYAYTDAFVPSVSNFFEVLETGNDYDNYTLGISGLIGMFQTTGQYSLEVQTMLGLLRDCQYDDGGFNWKYGTVDGGPGYQATAYAMLALSPYTADPLNGTALYDGGVWLGTYQDVSGGFLYTSGLHYPEIGGECGIALLAAAKRSGANIGASLPVGGDLLMCSEDNLMTFSLDVNPATPLVIGFEVVVDITGDLPGTIDIDEALGLGADYFQVTGTGPYSVNGSFYMGNGISADTDLFTIFFDGLIEGAVDVSVVSYNLRGPDNVFIFGDVSGAGFVVDCTAPAAVTDITAAPHHNEVEVGWTHDGTDVDEYWVYRGMWNDGNILVSAYPEYDDLPSFDIPDHPAAGLPSPGQGWVRADGGGLGFAVDSFFDIFIQVPDDLQRGAFSYEVYAVDAAGNISDPAAANAAATNYWLGDMTLVGSLDPADDIADGFVTPLPDITDLGTAFGEDDGDGNYNAFCDVGPTDDWSRTGIPTTDDHINFEDLMVFSMNFGVVTDINKSEDSISSMAQLAWVEAGKGQYALRLLGGDGIKGVHVTSSHAVSSVIAGDLLDAQDEMTFLKNIGSAMDISISVMGLGNGFNGAGDLVIVNTGSQIDVADLTIEVRGHDNSVIQVSLDGTSGTVTPRVFALNAAFPNPFNPMTKISYSLPEAQDVRLNVYGIDGKLVATLVNETRAAGLHEVIWNGQNNAGQVQASGLYFYRIEAGPYSQVQKMTLMK